MEARIGVPQVNSTKRQHRDFVMAGFAKGGEAHRLGIVFTENGTKHSEGCARSCGLGDLVNGMAGNADDGRRTAGERGHAILLVNLANIFGRDIIRPQMNALRAHSDG